VPRNTPSSLRSALLQDASRSPEGDLRKPLGAYLIWQIELSGKEIGMKLYTLFLIGAIILMIGCAPTQVTPTATLRPTVHPPTIMPTATPIYFPERLGPVWLSQTKTLAGYAYRSFMQLPVGTSWGPDGTLYVADWGGRHVVRVAKDGTMDDLPFWHTITALQDDGPRGVAFDSHGNFYVHNHSRIFRIDANGNITELVGVHGSPIGGIAISATDELYYTDRNKNGSLQKWDPSGSSQTIVFNLPFAENIMFAPDGTLYLTQMGQGQVLKIDVNTGTTSTFATDVCSFDPCYLAVDHEGDIWVRGISILTQLSPSGIAKTFVVDGEKYPGGSFNWQTSGGIAFDDEGGLWVASYTSKLVRLIPVTPNQPDPEFTLQVIAPNFDASDLEVGLNGEIYAPNVNTGDVTRVNSDGTIDSIFHYGYEGNVALSIDTAGTIYVGMPNGEIVRLEANGSVTHYAQLLTRDMAFGADGALYAVVANWNEPKAIVRITGVDTYAIVTKEIDGISLGNNEIHISPALAEGMYVFTEGQCNLFKMDFEGAGKLVANLNDQGCSAPAIMAASLVTGLVYIIPHGPYKAFQVDLNGLVTEYATNLFGDPIGMVVSSDGKWLYVAEAGAIDKIPLVEGFP
jgi:sugar lactone lactonase YvrE